jgi:hypothetical protein
MKKHNLLRIAFLVMLLFVTNIGFGQILEWQFYAAPGGGKDLTYTATTNNANLETSVLSRGTGAPGNASVSNAFVSVMSVSANKARLLRIIRIMNFQLNQSRVIMYHLPTWIAT